MKPACTPAVAAWFDYPAEHEMWKPRVDRAIALCSGCPLRTSCLTTATRDKETGVWGGRLLLNGKPVHDDRFTRPTPENADEFRAAHAAWTRGVRDEWAEEGERIYQRLKKREQSRRKKEARAA